jgi:hypothetical protein
LCIHLTRLSHVRGQEAVAQQIKQPLVEREPSPGIRGASRKRCVVIPYTWEVAVDKYVINCFVMKSANESGDYSAVPVGIPDTMQCRIYLNNLIG